MKQQRLNASVEHVPEDGRPAAVPIATEPMLEGIARALDQFGLPVCVFDESDHLRLWNESLLRMFPEHAGQIAVGETYRDVLRRLHAVRHAAQPTALVEHAVDEDMARDLAPPTVGLSSGGGEQHGARMARSSVQVPGVGRLRIWHPQVLPVPAAPQGPDAHRRTPVNGAAFFEQMTDGVLVCGDDERIAWVNGAFTRMYGLPDRAEAAGKSFADLYRQAWAGDPAAQPGLSHGLALLAQQADSAGVPFELPLPGGRWSRILGQRSPDGRRIDWHVDITVLKEKSALLEATLERMEQGVMMVGANRVVEVCNRRARELLDLPKALMDSRPTVDALVQFQRRNGEFESTPPELIDGAHDGDLFHHAFCYDRKRPNGRVIEVSSVPIDSGGVLCTYTDITERKRAEERIRHIARHDGLTSLVNREVFLEHLTAAINDPVRRAEGFAVHFIDIDRFKPINDRCGHAVGDKVLAVLAERMRLIARDVDVVARMGGDEFAVLQYQVDQPEGALGLANRLREGVAAVMEIESHQLRVGASVGIALHRAADPGAELAGAPVRAETADTLLRHADAAMYAAKASGGVRVFGFDGLDSAWAEVQA
jgi:diguanylate cyclase (GGDEF)-like protein